MLSRWFDRFRRDLSPARAIVLAFAAAILVGTLLLALPWAHQDARVSLLDALFTATSAVCVTGLIVVDTGGAFSRFGELVVMLLIKSGGIGILSLGALVALATGRRLSFRERLELQTQAGRPQVGGVVRFMRRLLIVTTAVELAGALVLYPSFARAEGWLEGAWFALFHSVSAFNNAGFSLYADSLTRFAADPLVSLGIPLLFVLGGLGLLVVLEVVGRWRGPRRRMGLHARTVLITTALLGVAGPLTVLAFEWGNPATLGALEPAARPLAALFQGLTPRTAGFNTLDYASMATPTLLVTMFLMFVGGSPGSTAGGVKTTTFALLTASVWAYTRGRKELVLFDRRVAAEVVMRAGVIVSMAILTIGVALTLLALTEPQIPYLVLMFETVSAFGTVGLSMGATGMLGGAGTWIVIVLMFVGRVGLLTFALALAEEAKPNRFKHPREDLIVG